MFHSIALGILYITLALILLGCALFLLFVVAYSFCKICYVLFGKFENVIERFKELGI